MATYFPWLMEPDWTQGVTETLAWKTDVLQSPSGAEQRIARRLSPRRLFEFSILAGDTDRQWLENALSQVGGSAWAMPVFPDRSMLTKSAAAGSTQLAVDTQGRDFSPGATVLLKSHFGMGAPSALLMVSAVEPDTLILARPLLSDWHVGTPCFPVRSAVLTDPPVFSRLNSVLSSAQVRFRVAEHNAFPEKVSLPLYRGHPVLEPATDRVDNLTASYQRLISELDNGSGIPVRLDTARRPFILQKHNWLLAGRAEQCALRQLLYFLRGRQHVVWIPSQNEDCFPVKGLEGNRLLIKRSGFSEMGILAGRRDLRIQLANGSTLYRRITAVALQGEDNERLALDGISVDIPLANIIRVSLMSLCRQNNDAVAWSHLTDANGVASVATSFIGVRDELESV